MVDGDISENGYELFKQIGESRGMKFMNELHGRSFSLNIFQMNAVALIEAALHVSDPDHGMALMMDSNREAGQQAHRELNRHLHNFTASAMTLVEHTRVFINENYADTDVYSAYQTQISSVFKGDPVSQFVQKLRNYMVHKGLPDSEMFFDLQNDPDEGAKVQTGIRIGTASLLEWDGWSPPARKYIAASGKHLDIRSFTEEYVTRVNRFHAGLEDALRRFHAADLAETERLQALYQDRSAASEILRKQEDREGSDAHQVALPPVSEREARLAKMRSATDALSLEIVSKIREVRFRQHETDFPSQRHSAVTLTDADMVGEVVFWGPDENHIPTLTYIWHGEKNFGLAETDHEAVEPLIDAALGLSWAGEMFSRKFVEDVFLAWSRSKFTDPNTGTFAEALLAAADEKIKPVAVWLPIAHLEIEDEVTFGPVKIAPITDAMMSDLETKATALGGASSEQIAGLFQQIRTDIQGSAAIVIPMVAEPILAEDVALITARDAVNLFRFFSPGAPLISMLCPTALMGAELIPGSKVLFITEAGLSSMTSKTGAVNVARWRLRTRDLAQLNKVGLPLAGRLVAPERLSEFESSVRTSLITYSKGTTFPDPLDRLGHALAAVEGVLLKHSMEPVEFSVADRMSFLLTSRAEERQEITQNIRQAYRLRTRHRAASLAPSEAEALQLFVFRAHAVLIDVLLNMEKFRSRNEFVGAVDQLADQ